MIVVLFLFLASSLTMKLPWPCGQSFRITQDFNGCGWHGCSTCGSVGDHGKVATKGGMIDFGLPANTRILAVESGVVRFSATRSVPGDACYAGSLSCCGRDTSNYVVVDHSNGEATLYMHLNTISVRVGQRVAEGELLGYSGSTGCSTGPHLHFQRQTQCGSYWCPSVRPTFDDWTGSLNFCTTLTSGNCPARMPAPTTDAPQLPVPQTTTAAAIVEFCSQRLTDGTYCDNDFRDLIRCRQQAIDEWISCDGAGCTAGVDVGTDRCNDPLPILPFCETIGDDGTYCSDARTLVTCANRTQIDAANCAVGRGCIDAPDGYVDQCDVATTPCAAPSDGIGKGVCVKSDDCTLSGLASAKSNSCSSDTKCCSRMICSPPKGAMRSSVMQCADVTFCRSLGGTNYPFIFPCSKHRSASVQCCVFPNDIELPAIPGANSAAFFDDGGELLPDASSIRISLSSLLIGLAALQCIIV